MTSTPVPVPSSLLVKRKRDETPVDSLYVHPDDSNKRRLTEPAAAFYFKRISSSAPPSDVASPLSTPKLGVGTSVSARTSPAPFGPRRFHLSRPPSVAPDATEAVKSRKRRRDNVAVFVEDRALKAVRRDEAVVVSSEDTETVEKELKRPNTQAVKIEKPKVIEPPAEASKEAQPQAQSKAVPPEIAQLLAEEEAKEAASSKPKLKYQPHPIPRRKDRLPAPVDDTEIVDVEMTTDDGDYVYDTYVREPILPDAPTLAEMIHPGLNLSSGNIGYLILPPDTDELWETFLTPSPASSQKFTDDEDSNAEDYYGNDYPEDELDSDDERGVGAYNKYRHGSDEEEWGPEDDAYEGSEDGDRHDDDPFGTGEIGKPTKFGGAGYSVW